MRNFIKISILVLLREYVDHALDLVLELPEEDKAVVELPQVVLPGPLQRDAEGVIDEEAAEIARDVEGKSKAHQEHNEIFARTGLLL